MSELEFAKERMTNAYDIVLAASVIEAKARAEFARLTLLKLAEKYPDIKGFSFSVDFEYDDEGSYFPTTNIYADVDEVEQGHEYDIDDELIELAHSMDQSTVDLLNEHSGKGGSVSIETLKEVRF